MSKKKVYTFVRGAMPSIVWDPVKGKALAEFCDPINKKVTGIFTTDDQKVADVLISMGYKEMDDYPDGAPEGGFEPIIPEPPDHITPGGPVPVPKKIPIPIVDVVNKGIDIKVNEDKIVTKETSKVSKDKKLIRRRKDK